MRVRFMLVCATAGLMGSVFALQACGDTVDEGPTTQDAGAPDVFEASVVKDTGTDVADSAPACDPNVDLFETIPDASIADGASSVGTCLGCAQANCSSEIKDCQEDCTCQSIAGDALECYAKNASIAVCLSKFLSVPKATQTIGIALGTCVQSKCTAECAAETFVDAGADAADAADQ